MSLLHGKCKLNMLYIIKSYLEFLSVVDAQIHMRQLRERNARKSEEVIELWDTVLADFSHKLGDDCKLLETNVTVIFMCACMSP